MKAVAMTAAGVLDVVDKPEPKPGPGEVVVAVERCGICGSDLHLRFSGMLPHGAVMGHEFAGTVVQVGADAEGVNEGDRVAVLPGARCGHCPACLEGRTQICHAQATTSLGLGGNDGAFAELVKTAVSTCYPLPQAMTTEQGALVEPYAVGLHAVRRSRAAVGKDTPVAIIGAGPIGLMTLAALRAEGVEHVAVAERSESRAAVAEAMGAAVVDDASRLGTAIGEQPEVVFECAGSGATPQLALNEVRPGGQVVLVGVADPVDPITLMSVLWVVKEVDFVPSIAYTNEEFAEGVRAVAGGAVDPAVMVSDVRPLDAAEATFNDLSRPGGPVKVLLAP